MNKKEFEVELKQLKNWKFLKKIFLELYQKENILITIKGTYMVGKFSTDSWEFFPSFVKDLLDTQPLKDPICLIVREFTQLSYNNNNINRISSLVLLPEGCMLLGKESVENSFVNKKENEQFLSTQKHFKILGIDALLDKTIKFI